MINKYDYKNITKIVSDYRNNDITKSQFKDGVLPALTEWNRAYRDSESLISDVEYDMVWNEFRRAFPDHPFITNIEPETSSWRETVVHDVPMLSIDKAVGDKGTTNWLKRVSGAAKQAGISATIRVTPKLDGNAGCKEGGILSTRGRDGHVGYNVSHLFGMGLVYDGNDGIGEIVITKDYYNKHLKPNDDDVALAERNVTTSLCNAITPRSAYRKAIESGAVAFVRYTSLDAWVGSAADYDKNQSTIAKELQDNCIYPTDGVVAEVLEPEIRAILGSTNSYNNWNFARKDVGETASSVVRNVAWQVGRTGIVTPVLKIDPVKVSGAMISSITSSNARMLCNDGMGIGAEIEVVRSGLVIPDVYKVTKRAEGILITNCPCCDTELIYDDVRLICPNSSCSAQIGKSLVHFTSALGIKYIGKSYADILISYGITIETLLRTTYKDMINAGMSSGMASKIYSEINNAILRPIEDWRVLASFGIHYLGRGDSKRLLARYPLNKVTRLSADQISDIKDFGDKTAGVISKELHIRSNEISTVISSLKAIRDSSSAITGPLSGKSFVFTGVLSRPRSGMEKYAIGLGANVSSSITKKVDYLVAGDKAGDAKINSAKAKGVTCINEDEFNKLIA